MGYQPVTDALAHVIPGYDDFFQPPVHHLDLAETAVRDRWVLEWFRDNSAETVIEATR